MKQAQRLPSVDPDDPEYRRLHYVRYADDLDEISLAREIDTGSSVEGLALSTIHAAKGLEWPVVFVAGLEDGLLPHARALDGLEGEGEGTPQASAPASPAKVEEMRRRVLELSARLGVDEDKALAWVEKRYGQPLDALSAEQVADAVRSLAYELNRRNGLPAERRGNRRRAA